MGDVALCGLTTRLLKSYFPQSHLVFITSHSFREVAESMPGVDEVVVGDKALPKPKEVITILKHFSRSSPPRSPVLLKHNFSPTSSQERNVSHTIFIDLQNNWRTRLFTWQLYWVRHRFLSPEETCKVFRFHRSRFWRWLRIYFPFLAKHFNPPQAVALQYLKAIEELGVKDDGGGIRLKVKAEWRMRAERILYEHLSQWGLPETTSIWIAVPGAKHKTKQWLQEYWVELLNWGGENLQAVPVIIGNKDEEELCGKIASSISSPVINLSGKCSLGEILALIERALWVVGGDTGPVHLAAGLGKPVVAIFGPTLPEFGFAPFRTEAVIWERKDLKCRPCHPHGTERCPESHFRCMREITSPQVVDSLRTISQNLGVKLRES